MHYYHCGLSTQFLAHVPGKTAQDGPTSRTHASQARAIIPGCCFNLAQSQPSRSPGEWTSRLKIFLCLSLSYCSSFKKKKKSKLTTDLSCGIFSPFPNKGGSHGILRLFESEIKLLASHWDITSITLKPVPKFLTLWSHRWMPERVLAKGNAIPASIREPLSLKWFIPGGLELAPLNCKFMDKTAGWGFRNHTKNGTNSSSLVWVLFPSLTNEGHCGTQFLKVPAAQMMPYPWAAYSKAKKQKKMAF